MSDRSLPALPMCDVCSDPGRCCREFTLHGEAEPMSFWKSEGTALHALVRLARYGLPMLPSRQDGPWKDPASGEEYVYWWVACPELRPNGRCGIYEDRPQLCRDFAPGSGALCVYYSPEVAS